MAHRLPSRIATVVIATALLFMGTTALSIMWMTRALDRQALVQSETQVEIARANLKARVRMITLDYTKWDAAYDAMRAADLPWLLDNVGSAAIIGEVIQLVVLWGDEVGGDHGWADDGVIEARPGLLPPEILDKAEAAVDGVMPGGFDAAEFFHWRGDDLFVMGVSHFEAVEDAERLPSEQRFAGQLIMGIRIDEEVVGDIGRSLMLADARIAREPIAGRPSLVLPGLDGEPVAYITWELPRPGTTMLLRLLPLLLLVSVAAAVLAFLNMSLVRRSAHHLVVAEQRASSAARTDALTGLPNRMAFNEALATPARAGERALLFLDLNGFKSVNDSLGHAAGDQVIAAAAQRLARILDPSCILARIAGDEFVLMVTGRNARDRIKSLAQACNHAFDAPFEVKGHHLHLQAAIGYAVQDTDTMPGSDLMRQADLAMYEGKRLRERAPVAFRAMMEEASQNAFLVERALRTALASRPHEISVAYQPIVTMDGQFRHAEVLARWTSLEQGRIPPSRFVAVAEKAGLIIELGRLILARVCRDLHVHPELRVSVNISPLQLSAPDFLSDFLRDLEALSIDPARIEIELTESVLVKDPVMAARHLQQLQAAGFSIALDDFGTGYSSVAYLEQLSFNTLKIDRSFVSGVRLVPKRQALLRAMIQMAHGLDLRVVCEGVENMEDLKVLRQLDCDLVQGYYFDWPLEIDELVSRWVPVPEVRGVA